MNKSGRLLSLLIILLWIYIINAFYIVLADKFGTIEIYNDDLSDSIWTDFDHNNWILNDNLVLVLKTKLSYEGSEKLIIDLSDLVWNSWSVAWIPLVKVATYTWDIINSIKSIPEPNSILWDTPINNFEDNIWLANACTLSWSQIECNVPSGKTLNQFTWILVYWLSFTNDVLNSDPIIYSEIRDVNIWWTILDYWTLRVPLVRSWSINTQTTQLINSLDTGGAAVFSVSVLTNISISVQNPENMAISPINWNSDAVSVSWSLSVFTNSPGWYTVATKNDGQANTLRNISNQTYQITDLNLSWVSGSLLYDAWFWICAKDAVDTICNNELDVFRWVWANWIEIFREAQNEDTSFELTYHLDVPWIQKSWIYQGIVVFMAAVNL